MKIIKYIPIFLIPAILGIYFGLRNKNPDISPVDYVENEEIVSVEKTGESVATVDRPDVGFEDVKKTMEATSGMYSLYVKDLETKKVYEHNSDYFYNAASVFKVFVAVSVMKNIEQKNIGMDYFYKITPEDYEQGTGILQYEDIGTTYPVSELLSLSLKKSDNVAQNILIRAINKTYVGGGAFPEDNETSVRKVGVFLEEFYDNKYISKESRDYLLEIMKKTDFDDRINLGLSNSVEFAHKIGNWPYTSSWHDCGVVLGKTSDVVVCLMSKNAMFEDFQQVAKNVGYFVEDLATK